ncbi:MAG: DNA-processing protein DprA [Planctomycetota bacterium]
MAIDAHTALLLRLHLISGIGPTLGRRLLALFDDPMRLLRASGAELQRVERIGPAKARRIVEGLRASEAAATDELRRCDQLGVHVVGLGSSAYPPLLAEQGDAPLVLFVRGDLACVRDGFNAAIVGSRRCTAYGMEQAERFAGALASAGICVVSGGARGIDSAAHRAAVRCNGATVAVLGCGLGRCYPPENRELFDGIVDAGGAVVSELPVETNPSPENFPARNRIIAGLSLGIIVVEAPMGSGALITARLAVEQGREVMVVPGRVDSASSEGGHGLIKRSEAALVTSPADVVDLLEPQARHVHLGTHATLYADPQAPLPETAVATTASSVSDAQRVVLEAISGGGLTMEELHRQTGLQPHVLRAEITMLELSGRVRWDGSRLERRGPGGGRK